MPGHDIIVSPGAIVCIDQERDALDEAVDAFAASAKVRRHTVRATQG